MKVGDLVVVTKLTAFYEDVKSFKEGWHSIALIPSGTTGLILELISFRYSSRDEEDVVVKLLVKDQVGFMNRLSLGVIQSP